MSNREAFTLGIEANGFQSYYSKNTMTSDRILKEFHNLDARVLLSI